MYDILYTMIDCVLYAFIARIYYRSIYVISLKNIGKIISGIMILMCMYFYFKFEDALTIIPCYFLYGLLNEKLNKKIIVILFTYLYVLAIQLIWFNVLQIHYKDYLYNQNWLLSVSLILLHVILLIIVSKLKLYNIVCIQIEELITFMLFCFIQLVINSIYNNISQSFNSILVCIIFLLYKLYKYKKYKEQQQNDLWKDSFIKKQEENFMELEKRYEDVRRFQHDFHHHMYVIKNISKNQANTYIDNIVKEYENLKVQRCTNMYVDVMIKEYKLKSKQYHIEFHHSFYVEGVIYIESTDLTLLLSNLLQNAVEAIQKPTVLNKNIKLFMHNVKYHLVIEIENSVEKNCDIHYLKEKRTSKFNKDKHGYGLKTIEHIIEKYSGDITYEIKDEKIKIQIMLQGVVEI